MPRDERTLLLLGLLMVQSQHGYQINEFIEHNLKAVVDMKKSTAYAVLDRLAARGYVSVETVQEGRRPPRHVYSITEAGIERFRSLLGDGLASPDPRAGDVPLMFLDHLPREEVVDALTHRLRAVQGQLEERRRLPSHAMVRGVDLAIQHQIALFEAEILWIESALHALTAPTP